MGLLTRGLLSSPVSVVGHARAGPLQGVGTLDPYLNGASRAVLPQNRTRSLQPLKHSVPTAYSYGAVQVSNLFGRSLISTDE